MLPVCQDTLIAYENHAFMLQRVIRFKKMSDGSRPSVNGLHATPLIWVLCILEILSFLVISSILDLLSFLGFLRSLNIAMILASA